MQRAPAISAFYKDGSGTVFHTYSAYSRRIEAVNGAYAWLDLMPKGRDEGELPFPMAWLRLHDEYAR